MAPGILLLFDQLSHHRLGREQQPGDGCRVLQRGAAHLGRIEHTHFDHITELLGLGVEAEIAFSFRDLVHDHRRFGAGIGDDHAQWLFQGSPDDLDAGFLVGVLALDLVERRPGADVRNPAAGDNAFLDRRARGVQGVFYARFLFFHLHLGRRADLDHRHATCELGYTLLQFLFVVIAGRFVDLGTDVLDPRLDRFGIAGTVDDRGFFLCNLNAFRAPEILQARFLGGRALFNNNHLAAGKDSDVFEHGLAAVAEPRRLHGRSLENSAQVVYHQRRERLALDFFGDDEKRLAGLGYLLQNRQQLPDVRDLLVVQKNVGILQHRNLLLRVVDEIRREIPSVELHAFDHLELVLQALAVLDGDHAFLP